jgi:glycosyltransferase involved in cell wall biosynthesis
MKKIINVSSFSRSKNNQDPIKGSYYGWHSQFARAITRSQKYAVESWAIDVSMKKEVVYEKDSLIYRIFPTALFFSPGREFSWKLIKKLKEEVSKNDIVIHLHDFHNWQAYLICFIFRKVPIIAHYHGATLFPLERLKNKKKIIFLPIYLAEHFIEKLILPNVDYFMLPNSSQENYFKKRRFKTVFCPMGADYSIFGKLDKVQCREKLGISRSESLLLNVGGFAKQKNIEFSVKILAELAKKRNCVLYIIGPTYNDGYKAKMIEKIAKFGLRKSVKIIGMIDREKLNIFYNAADVLLVTSKDEGGPTVVLEAMAAGLPVVSTPVGFVKDFFRKADGRLKIIEGHALSDACNKIEEVFSMGNEKKSGIKLWGWNDVETAAFSVYEKL